MFEDLRQGLEEGIAFAKGKKDLRTARLEVAPPPEYDAKSIARLRLHLRLSQSLFARALNVSPKTVQSWEQGYRRPRQSALRLLELIDKRPGLVEELISEAK
jgi:putative transcriptional regulator